MYKLVVQLKECDIHGNEYGQTIHEAISRAYPSIQEAFESMESGKEMFQIYMEIDNIIKQGSQNYK